MGRSVCRTGIIIMRPGITASAPAARPCGCGCGATACPSLSHPLLELASVAVEMTRGLVSGESYDPRWMTLHAVRAGAAFAEGISVGLPGSHGMRWQELANKLTAYRLFASSDRFLPAGTKLSPAVGELAVPDLFSRLWITEGLGWCWAYRNAAINIALSDDSLPRHALIPDRKAHV